MNYQYARIRLSDTDYHPCVPYQFAAVTPDVVARCQEIYAAYCRYRQFPSVMPLFSSQLQDPMTDVLLYPAAGVVQAFSMIRRLDTHSAWAQQFAWTYHDPAQRLGILSLETECAIYRDLGFQWLYLDRADPYKHQFQGFEILGPML